MTNVNNTETENFLNSISADTQSIFTFTSSIGPAIQHVANPDPASVGTLPTVTAPLYGLIKDSDNQLSELNAFLRQLSNGLYPDAHTDFLQFIYNLKVYTSNPTNNNEDALKNTTAYTYFLGTFVDAVGFKIDGISSNSLGDWDSLNPDGSVSFIEFANEQFLTSMNHFLTFYIFQPNLTGEEFVNDWLKYVSARTSIETSPTSDGTKLTTYRDLYFSFVPNATEADFQSNFQAFYNSVKTDNNYFLPSQFLDQWFSQVQSIRNIQTNQNSSVTGTNAYKTSIIFEIFSLLTDMIGTLQKVAASQGDRLTFYANAQKAYTDLIGKIPTITRDNLTPYVDDSDTNLNQLAQEISTINDAYTEKLKSYRSILGDDAKQQQSVVNQSNEAVNQQADLATALLQELSTILQAIFK